MQKAAKSRGKIKRDALGELGLTQKFVIEYGSSETHAVLIGLRFTRADNAALAQYATVLLARDFFRHLENHLDESVVGQGFRTVQQHAGLAQIVNDSFVPVAQVLDAVAHGRVQTQAARTRHPARFLGMAPAAARSSSGLLGRRLNALDAAHCFPIVLVLHGADQANLVILTVGGPTGPGELVGAAAKHEYIHQLRHVLVSGHNHRKSYDLPEHGTWIGYFRVTRLL